MVSADCIFNIILECNTGKSIQPVFLILRSLCIIINLRLQRPSIFFFTKLVTISILIFIHE